VIGGFFGVVVKLQNKKTVLVLGNLESMHINELLLENI
jgi:hypothetical protein